MILPEGPLILPDDPVVALQQWLQAAKDFPCPEPTAMTLATSSLSGRPSARIVLLKSLSHEGLEFFTNYESPKAQQLLVNPQAALVFHWIPLHRQVRIEGTVSKLSYEESNEYFQSRARGSQIGAWSSPQSQEILSRDELVEKVRATEEKYAGKEIPCPSYWGGFRLQPDRIEFWEERSFRLHERALFKLNNDSKWKRTRLAP